MPGTNYIWNMQQTDGITTTSVKNLSVKVRKEGGTNVYLEKYAARGGIKFTEDDKLTIVGHGTPGATPGYGTLGGMFPRKLAEMVVKCGFKSVPKIVLLMCGDADADATKKFAQAMGKLDYNGLIVG